MVLWDCCKASVGCVKFHVFFMAIYEVGPFLTAITCVPWLVLAGSELGIAMTMIGLQSVGSARAPLTRSFSHCGHHCIEKDRFIFQKVHKIMLTLKMICTMCSILYNTAC